MKTEEIYKVQVLDRAIALLEALSNESGGLTLIELSEEMGLHRSTMYRLLMVLERNRYVTKNASTGKFFLGYRFFELASKVIRNSDPAREARPHLEKLVAEVGETAHLCVLDEGEVLYLAKVEGARAVRVPSIVGRRYPAHCGGAGKALLAHVPPEALEDILKRRGLPAFTASTIVTPAQLKAELQRIKECGYSVDDEEYEEGLRCVGAPVRDYTENVIAAISVAAPAFRLTHDDVPLVAKAVMEAAAQLSGELGYRQQPPETRVAVGLAAR
jgi:DNA-binding IclR family transcriptional regulator